MTEHDIVVTDWEFADLSIEEEVLARHGLPLRDVQSRDPDEIAGRATGATALLVQYAPITGALMERLPSLQLVVRYGVGLDNVDLEAARAHGVGVCNVVDYGTEEVAVHTAGLLLAAHRHVHVLDRQIRGGGWDYRATGAIPRLSELTLGCVGFGRIGRLVAERVGPWFAQVLAHDPYAPDEGWPGGIGRCDLDELMSAADIVTLHLPLTEETGGLLDADRLARLPQGALVVNTSRGGLVDVDALLAALDAGRLRGAALDVLPEEPPAPDHPIRTHPRVLLTPHAAWYSESAERDLRRLAAQQVAAWARGEEPAFLVVRPEPVGPGSR